MYIYPTIPSLSPLLSIAPTRLLFIRCGSAIPRCSTRPKRITTLQMLRIAGWLRLQGWYDYR